MYEDGSSPADILEKRILYEADTIDANIGLPAFYRNVQIRTHYARAEKGRSDLEEYVSHIEPWIDGKTFFLDKIETKAGKHLARRRLNRMKKISRQITKEPDEDFRLGSTYGLLGIIREFMDHNQDPDLQDEMIFLTNSWIPQRRKMLKTERDSKARLIFQEAEEFCSLLLREIDGM